MGVALGWIAMALAGMADAPRAERSPTEIGYTVRFVETEGLGWREAVFARLTPVTRQGAATVWTAPRSVRQRLIEHALKEPAAHVLQAPRVTGQTGAPVHVSVRANRQLVTQVAWDGEDRAATGKPETVRTGSVATMAGRKLDQGILVQLVLEDTAIRAVHRVSLGRSAEPKSAPMTRKAAYQAGACSEAPACCQAATCQKASAPAPASAAGYCLTPREISSPWEMNILALAASPSLTGIFPSGAMGPSCTGAGQCPGPATAVVPNEPPILSQDQMAGLPTPFNPYASAPIAPAAVPWYRLPPMRHWGPQGTIAEIRVWGNATIPIEKVKQKLLSRVGQPLDDQKITADFKTLKATKWFSDVQVFAQNAPSKNGELILSFGLWQSPARTDTTVKLAGGADCAESSACCPGNAAEKASLSVMATSSSPSPCGKCAIAQAHSDCASPASAPCSPSTNPDAAAPVAIEVPEIGSQEIAGEWLIPKDGILLVSFGPYTVAGRDGKAVVRERLAIVEAEEAVDRPASPHATRSGIPRPVPRLPIDDADAAPQPIAKLPMPVPALPSRTIPQGVHADGSLAELPPLPPDEAEEAPSESSEPRSSPQGKKPRQPESAPTPAPATDSRMNKVGYSVPSFPAIPSLFMPAPAVGLQFLIPLKPLSIRLPLNRRLEIEVYGRVVPNPEPARKPRQ
jgi:hypothetical protein